MWFTLCVCGGGNSVFKEITTWFSCYTRILELFKNILADFFCKGTNRALGGCTCVLVIFS